MIIAVGAITIPVATVRTDTRANEMASKSFDNRTEAKKAMMKARVTKSLRNGIVSFPKAML